MSIGWALIQFNTTTTTNNNNMLPLQCMQPIEHLLDFGLGASKGWIDAILC